MVSAARASKVRAALRFGVIGGVALTTFFYCFLTGDDDVLRRGPSRTNRVARADFDHDTHAEGCFTVPATAAAHDTVEIFIRGASSSQTAPDPAIAIVPEQVTVPPPGLTNEPVFAAIRLSAESQVLLRGGSRGPPRV
jgi:hypothetical protein